MTEAEFWVQLEYRVSAELAGLSDPGLRRLWCDGFISETQAHDGRSVTGRAWVGTGSRHQESWDFTLVVGDAHEPEDWTVLLPPDDVTGWLSLDVAAKKMKIDPRAAYADPPPA
ncbi:MAG TPA: hypothetical protein VF796_20940 [Humisphaera sp.]